MALRGTNQEFGRPYNRRIVLESIRLHGPIARGDIASRVGLTVQTVSTIVRELEEHGYVLSVREEPKGRGLPPATLRINPEGGYAVGIHVTPLGINAALINLSGDVIESTTREAPNATPDHAFELIGAMVLELTGLRPGGRVLGIGMALPGPFGVESMSFVGPTTMTGWKDVALRERLTASTGLPAFFENDMAAAAIGERLYGLGAGYSEYYYLYFGVGLGGAMVHDGAVLRGAWGNAGEIGHVPAVPDGELCPCGNSGCLERYFSLDAFRRRNISDAAWVAEVAPIFRNAIAIIENLFDPETVILGGLAPAGLLERLV
ncbi:MAG: ROK family transcriptional regulator, partial [Mesorhizobium sp.]